jgi:serine phosphatase RsbU (regulator of sigma subunit)
MSNAKITSDHISDVLLNQIKSMLNEAITSSSVENSKYLVDRLSKLDEMNTKFDSKLDEMNKKFEANSRDLRNLRDEQERIGRNITAQRDSPVIRRAERTYDGAQAVSVTGNESRSRSYAR